MTSYVKVFVAVGLLCAAAQAIKSRNFFNKYILNFHIDYYEILNVNKNFLGAFCYVKYMKINEAFCWFKLQTVNGIAKNCDVHLVVPKGNTISLERKYRANLKTMLEGKIAVLEWFSGGNMQGNPDEQHKKISLVDMESCNATHLDFPLDNRQRMPNNNVLVYHDCFHVYVDSKERCGEHRSPCILRYDHKGNRVGEPVTFPSKYYEYGHSMVVDRLNSSSGGFFTTFKPCSKENQTDGCYLMTSSHLSLDGSETDLFENYLESSEKWVIYEEKTNGHENFAFCYEYARKCTNVHCIQYNVLNGQKMINTTIDMQKNQQVQRVFNLRGGGILLVYYLALEDRHYEFRMKVVDTHGRATRDDLLIHDKVGHWWFDWISVCNVNHVETDSKHCFYFTKAEYVVVGTLIKTTIKCIDKTAKLE